MPANTDTSRALVSKFQDAWLLAGVRTPFIDYTQALSLASPIDLGIKAAREVLARSGAPAADVGTARMSTPRPAVGSPRHHSRCRKPGR